MKNNMLFICALFVITNLNAMAHENDDESAEKKITALMCEIDLATNEIIKLRVRTTCMESMIRSKIKGFENFTLLEKIPSKINPGARRIKHDAVTAQLAGTKMTNKQKALYRKAVLHLFDLEYEGMTLESSLEEMKAIVATYKQTNDQSNWCLLL